jgi:hypothetical protein
VKNYKDRESISFKAKRKDENSTEIDSVKQTHGQIKTVPVGSINVADETI